MIFISYFILETEEDTIGDPSYSHTPSHPRRSSLPSHPRASPLPHTVTSEEALPAERPSSDQERLKTTQKKIFYSSLGQIMFNLLFLPKLDEPFRDKETFNNLSVCKRSDLGFEGKTFCFYRLWLIRGSVYICYTYSIFFVSLNPIFFKKNK